MDMIFDFETLSTDRVNGVVLSLAILVYDETRFNEKQQYSYTELLEGSRFIKFNVEDQVKNYGRKIDPDTLKWWGEQSKEAQASQLAPSPRDQPLNEIINFINKHTSHCSLRRVYSRGNTFDNVFLDYIAQQVGQPVPWPHYIVRDTRTLIEGMSYGSGLSCSYVPEGLESMFVPHDPQHDIVMDVMRIQTLAIALG